MDQILVGALLGTQALGIYTIAHNFVISPTIRVNQVITTVMFPVFARLQDELEILRNGYLKLVKIVTILNTPILLGMALVAPFVIPLLFDPKWHESIYIIQILSVYALIRSTGSPAGSLQLAKGRADLGFKWNLGLLIISGPVIYAGIQWGGLTGMGWSLILLHAFLMIPYWIFMIRPLIGPPARSYF
jgi:O-antigen/teichoic acid export membrane protein